MQPVAPCGGLLLPRLAPRVLLPTTPLAHVCAEEGKDDEEAEEKEGGSTKTVAQVCLSFAGRLCLGKNTSVLHDGGEATQFTLISCRALCVAR